MDIPQFVKSILVDEEGKPTPYFSNYLMQLSEELTTNLSNQAYILPQQPTDNIDQFTGDNMVGGIVYDNTTNEIKVNVAGTWKVVQTV